MSSTSVTGLHYEQQQQQQHSIRTKQLRGRGLVAQVLPIEMQTLWYGNWQLQKPARIHTSMYWNHLRNVRCDGTSSPRQHRQMDQTSSMSGAGVRWWGDRGRDRERGWKQQNGWPFLSLLFPSFFLFLILSQHFFYFGETAWAQMREFGNTTCIFKDKTSHYSHWHGRKCPFHLRNHRRLQQ